MRSCTQILVCLRNADPTALTALTCLQRSLGFGDRLSEVRRRVLWELHGPVGADPGEVIGALSLTGELFNPNKEVAHVRRAGEALSALGTPLPGDAGWESFLAWNPDGNGEDLPHGFVRFRDRGWALVRGIMWSLRWKQAGVEQQLRWSRDAVLCTGPRQGLLVHPHLEDYRRIVADDLSPWLPEPESAPRV
jgi:hypothetical protein